MSSSEEDKREDLDKTSGTLKRPHYIYIIKLQLDFIPVAVVQQYNRQVTHITHKQSTNKQTNSVAFSPQANYAD
jgi:hypothetical protein